MAIFRKKAFGLDISDYSVELLELGSRSKVKNFSRIILESGIVKNGLILEKKELVKVLKILLGKAQISTNRVVLSLPEAKVFIHIFNIPKGLKGKNLKNAIAFEATKIIPLNPENVYWDCQVKACPPKSKEQSVLYVAVFKDIINTYLDVCQKTGLRPIVFEIESLALGRVLLKDIKPKNSLMIVDIGARTTNISIFDKHKILQWSSYLPLAGNHFTEEIAKKLNLSSQKAEELKIKEGLKENSKTIIPLQKKVEEIIEEIKNIFHYYQEPVEEIILSGGSAQLPELNNYFALKLKRKVSLGKSELAKQLKGNSIFYNTVVGLALKGAEGASEAEINLLPQKTKMKKSFIDKRVQGSLLFKIFGYVFPLLSLALWGWFVINYTPQKPRFKQILPQPSLNQQLEEEKHEEELEKKEPEETKEILSEPELEKTLKEEPEPEEIVKGKKQKEQVQEEQKTITQIQALSDIRSLNVRQGPGTSYGIVSKIRPGETYPLLQEQEQWYKIKLSAEEQGWVYASYVSLQEVQETPETETLIKQNTITVKQNNLGWLNVRQGPGTSYGIVSKIRPGETYPLLQEQEQWYKIKLSAEEQGWVYASYVDKNK